MTSPSVDDFHIEVRGNVALVWFKGALVAEVEAMGDEDLIELEVQTHRGEPLRVAMSESAFYATVSL